MERREECEEKRREGERREGHSSTEQVKKKKGMYMKNTERLRLKVGN